MVRAGLQPEHLAIQGMRKPGEGLPIRKIKCGERPLRPIPAKAILNVDVVAYTDIIVVIEELIAMNRIVHGKCANHEENAKNGPPKSDKVASPQPGIGEGFFCSNPRDSTRFPHALEDYTPNDLLALNWH